MGGWLWAAAMAAALAFLTLVPTGKAVIGGERADPARWGFVVAVLDANEASPMDAQFCAGTLIGRRWVMTAAHCVEAGGSFVPASDLEVASGVSRLAAIGDRDRIPVDRVVVAPGRRPNGSAVRGRDLALLHLARPATAGRPAALPAPIRTLGRTSGAAWIAGWGAIDPWGETLSEDLLDGRVSLMSASACGRFGAPSNTICATMPKRHDAAACEGDSGGPLARRDGSPTVIGVVSAGPCGDSSPTFYTSVAAYRSWILKTLRA
jgi:secreted trypsin-like serine protease